ncbi:CsbD family protein [Methylobacterium sp. Gmos1]
MMDTDRITGAARELGGKAQGTIGDLTGSHRDSAEGRVREAAGQAQNLFGQAKDQARDTVRDAVEQVADTARDIGGRIRETVGGLVGSDDVEDRARRAQGAVHDAFEEHADHARRSVRRAADEAGDAVERGTRALRHGGAGGPVAEYPLASLLVAGAVGFGLALLVTANRD